MAQQVDMEGTSTSGEAHEFESFLKENGVSQETIQKLVSNGLNSLSVLKVIENDDVNEICRDCKISALQKVKLKAAIMSLSSQSPSQSNLPPVLLYIHSVGTNPVDNIGNLQVIIDKEERLALTQMAKKIKAMEESVLLIDETTKSIDDEAKKHRNDIQSAFKQLHRSLDERESILLSKLEELVAVKKSTLLKWASSLTAKKEESQQKLNECESKVTKPTKIHELDSRIQQITAIAKEIESVEVLTAEHVAIRKKKINVILKNDSVMAAVSGFGSVSSGAVPVLLSLTDNKNASISVKWKLKEPRPRDSVDRGNKLKIEWSETKSDDLAQFDEKWEHSNEVEVSGDTKTATTKVSVENKVALYVFRIQYFDGNDWSPSSELRTVSVVEQITDSWDPRCTSKHLTLSGSSVTYKDKQSSSYGKRIVSEGIHSWTIRVDNVTSGWTLFGVWKSQFDPLLDTYFENCTNRSYSLVVNTGKLSNLALVGSYLNGLQYCARGKAGDVIKMTLDLNDCTLWYTVNGTACGKAFDVEKVSYRMACTLKGNSTQFTLLSYECEDH